MRRLFILALALLTLAAFTIPVGAAQNDVVRVHLRGSDAAAQESLKAEFGVRHDFTDLGLGFTSDVPLAALKGLEQRPGVRVERVPERRVLGQFVRGVGKIGGKPPKGGGRTATPSDQTPWGIETIYNDTALTGSSGGQGIVVAILDTGAASHVDLRKPGQCKDFTRAKRGQPFTDNSCSDGYGHGTHVAGTIAAYGGSDGLGIFGVAPSVAYWAYKVCGNSGFCWSDDIAAAIRHAADQGANIISMSLGGSVASDLERAAVQYAAQQGTLLVAAAGNSGPGANTIEYPGAFPEVMAVAALEQVTPGVTPADLQVANFSSRGLDNGDDATVAERELELSGPGVRVESTMNDGTYALASGTSMATPHMSGLAAKVWQGSAAATRDWLVTNATGYDITSADGGGAEAGFDEASGYGSARVN